MRINKKYIVFTFLFTFLFEICLSYSVKGEGINPYFEHIGREEGLPQVSVNVIAQDELGFLWIGTQGGLTRFDGCEFYTFKSELGNSSSLADNSVWDIVFDDDGMMWVGTNGGLSKFNRETEKFTNYRFDPKDSTTLSDDNVRVLLLDSQETLWVGTKNGGLNSCKIGGEEKLLFQRYKYDLNDKKSISGNYVQELCEDDKGCIWVGTNGDGLNCIDSKNKENGFLHFKFDSENPESISSNNVISIFKSRERGLFIGTDNGLDKFKEDGTGFEHFNNKFNDKTVLLNKSVSCMVEDFQGNLWIGSNDGGLVRMDKNYEFQKLVSQTDGNDISNCDVRDLYFDTQGLLWIGTYDNGLNKMDYSDGAFSILKNQVGYDRSISSNIVLSILEDKDNVLWIGTWNGGVNRLKDKENVDCNLINDPEDKTSISGNTVWTMEEDSRGDIWIGTWKNGLNRISAKERLEKEPKVIRYSHNSNNPRSLESDSIMSIYEDSRGILWIGTWGGGLNRLNPHDIEKDKIEFTKYQNDPENDQSIGDDYIKTITEDRFGNIWIGTWSGGISMLTSEAILSGKNEFKRYQMSWDDPNTLSHNDVTAIYQDDKGIFWISTYGGGLNRFDFQTGKFKCYTQKDGLSNNELYGVVQDNDGFLWISTNMGINKFNPESGVFEHQYDVRDGLQGDEFNQGAFLKGSNGDLYFGGVRGLSIIKPSDIVDNEFIPPVYFTELSVMHKVVPISESGILKKAIYNTDKITLSYKDASFGVRFAALNYRQSDKNNYFYMLEGFDENWIKTDYPVNSVQYTNLNPGIYVFRVKASNDDGIWNTEGTSLKVTILPPWWQLWWVRGIGILLFGSVLLGAYFMSTFFLRKQQIYLEREVCLRTEQINNQKKEITQINKEMFEKNMLLKQQAGELEKLIRQDSLTGLLNRRGFEEKAQEERLRAIRNNTTFAIIMGDIDFFKNINDQYGHDVGDIVLVNIAKKIKNAVREVDFIGRFGGEEFIILLIEIEKKEAITIAERLREDIANMVIESKGHSLKITLTQGIALFKQGQTLEQCIKSADIALYKGKANGKNRVEISS